MPSVAILGLATTSRIHATPLLLATTITTATLLLLASVLVATVCIKRCQRPVVVLSVKRVHFIQALMHCSIYVYWGMYWHQVVRYVPLLAVQLLVAYSLDAIVSITRRHRWVLGLGPVPIVLSTNLFLWFIDDLFWCQLAMIAASVLSKEFIVWKRDGARRHIFNPSAFGLCIASLILILSGSTQLSWGFAIANTLGRPPNIYLEIFALGLVVQALFATTAVTVAAIATLVAIGVPYHLVTGDVLFGDSSIPVLVFLGAHFFVTDPMTSPTHKLGKLLFGMLYAASIIMCYLILRRIGAPTFYDKLLCVPVLNIIVQKIDRLSASWCNMCGGKQWLVMLCNNKTLMVVWCLLFALLMASEYIPTAL